MHDLVDNAECPGCGARSTLDFEHGYPSARSCGACRGWFLERDTAYRFLVEDLGTASADIARMLATPGARQLRCPACDKRMSAIVVSGNDVDLCPGCGAAWLPPGVMHRLSGGHHGVEGPRGTPTPSVDRRAAAPRSAPPAAVAEAAASVSLSSAPSPFGLPGNSAPFGAPRPATSSPLSDVSSSQGRSAAATSEMPRAVSFPSSDGVVGGYGEIELELARPTRGATDPRIMPSEPPRSAGKRARARPPVKVGKEPAKRDVARTDSFEAAPLGTAGSTGHKKLILIAGGAALALTLVVIVLVISLGGPDEEVAAEPQQQGAESYATYLRHYHFGGRDLDWWSARLTELSPGGAAADARTYLLTKDRAQRLGLVVTEHPGRVEVTLSAPLTARLLERLEVQ